MPGPLVFLETLEAVRIVRAYFGRMVPKRRALEAFPDSRIVADFYPDNRIHDAPPGEDRANFRSATPMGFARAVFGANAPGRPVLANDNLSPDLFCGVA